MSDEPATRCKPSIWSEIRSVSNTTSKMTAIPFRRDDGVNLIELAALLCRLWVLVAEASGDREFPSRSHLGLSDATISGSVSFRKAL